MEKGILCGLFRLDLFDAGASGADGGADGAASGVSNAQAAGPEGSVQQAADAGQHQAQGGKRKGKRDDLSRVVYGKQAQEETVEPGQGNDAEPVEPPAEPDREKAFEDLIKGEYKDQFDRRTQKIVNARFRETKALQERLGELDPVLDLLSSKYGVGRDNIADLVKAVQEDDSLYEQEATEHGMTVEQWKKQKRLERENAALRRARDEAEQDSQARKIYDGWMQQADKVKEIYPQFDFAAECKNEKFVELIKSPAIDVRTAYEVIHRDEILSGVAAGAANRVRKKTVEDIQARGMRPPENGTRPQSTAILKPDVNSLTREDVAEINRRVRNGATITF